MSGRVLGVADVSAYLKQLIESDDFLNDLWVEGEVSDLFVSRNGHSYFTLNDGGAILRCVLFKGSAGRQRTRPRDGERVAVHGRCSVYEAQGRIQLSVDLVQPAGVGIQALMLELLRQKLEAEGLFDPSRKRPLPPTPHVIGVVTSADGAVWHDIQQVLGRRYPFAHLILSPTTVQGDRAPAGIVAALQRLLDDGRSEVVIIGRGGGSAEDLGAFNDEQVVRAAFAAPIPVISAVGHETDWTLLDLVADLRAPTPSAAAELVAPSIADYGRRLSERGEQLRRTARTGIAQRQTALLHQERRLLQRSPRQQLRFAAELVGQQRDALVETISMAFSDRQQHLDLRSGQLRNAVASRLRDTDARLRVSTAALTALNPHSVLKRGFAVIEQPQTGAVFSRAAQLSAGIEAQIRFIDGVASGTIDTVRLEPVTENRS